MLILMCRKAKVQYYGLLKLMFLNDEINKFIKKTDSFTFIVISVQPYASWRFFTPTRF